MVYINMVNYSSSYSKVPSMTNTTAPLFLIEATSLELELLN